MESSAFVWIVLVISLIALGLGSFALFMSMSRDESKMCFKRGEKEYCLVAEKEYLELTGGLLRIDKNLYGLDPAQNPGSGKTPPTNLESAVNILGGIGAFIKDATA